jgi:hypothetical protein
MVDVIAPITATHKLGIRVSDPVLSPAFRVEPAFSVRPATGSQSVLDVTAPNVNARAYLISGIGKIRLDIDMTSLENAIGHSLRDGDMYRITGTIDGTSTQFHARLSARSDYAYAFLDAADSSGVVPSRSYTLLVHRVERDRRFEVTEGSRGPCIRIYETVLKSLGIREDRSDGVVQLRVRDDRNEGRLVYVPYRSAVGWVQVPVNGIGAHVGDQIEIVDGMRYEVEDAVADFNGKRPESLGNVRMSLDDEGLSLIVDGQRFETENARLTAHGLQAVLKMKVGKTGIKFQVDGENIVPRFENSDRIEGFKTIRDGLYATREQLNGSHLRQLIPDTLCAMSYGEMKAWSMDKIIRMSCENEAEGAYVLEVTQEFQELVQRRLIYAGTRRKIEKGNVGEILASKLFESMGFQTVQDHPFSDDDQSRGSSRWGPESVVRSSMNGQIYYTEVKNHSDEERARRKAISQVRWYCKENPIYKGEDLSGAFIAITDWDGETSAVNFRVVEISSNVR